MHEIFDALLALILARAIHPHKHDRTNVTARCISKIIRVFCQLIEPVHRILQRGLPAQVSADLKPDRQLDHIFVFERAAGNVDQNIGKAQGRESPKVQEGNAD